jgi:hypothetical protein
LRQGVLAIAARHLGSTLGAHRHRLVSVFSLDDLLWRSFDIEKGHQKRNSLSYFLWGLTTLAKGLIGVAGAFVRRIVIVRRDCRMIVEAKLPLGIVTFYWWSLRGFI